MELCAYWTRGQGQSKQLVQKQLRANLARSYERMKKPQKPKLNERFVNEYLPEDIRKKSVEEKRAYTKSALIFYNNYLLEHPEEQVEWEEEDES